MVAGISPDLSNLESVRREFIIATAKYGCVDILVNNAAVWNRHGKFMEIPVDEWKTYFDINVMGAVYCTRAALPGMVERKYGRIINVASVAGVYGIYSMSHYSATKGALISFTKALATSLPHPTVGMIQISLRMPTLPSWRWKPVKVLGARFSGKASLGL